MRAGDWVRDGAAVAADTGVPVAQDVPVGVGGAARSRRAGAGAVAVAAAVAGTETAVCDRGATVDVEGTRGADGTGVADGTVGPDGTDVATGAGVADGNGVAEGAGVAGGAGARGTGELVATAARRTATGWSNATAAPRAEGAATRLVAVADGAAVRRAAAALGGSAPVATVGAATVMARAGRGVLVETGVLAGGPAADGKVGTSPGADVRAGGMGAPVLTTAGAGSAVGEGPVGGPDASPQPQIARATSAARPSIHPFTAAPRAILRHDPGCGE